MCHKLSARVGFACSMEAGKYTCSCVWFRSFGAKRFKDELFLNSRVASAAIVKAPTIGAFPSTNNNDTRSLAVVKPRIVDEAADKSRIWKLTEINEPLQCRSMKLPDSLSSMRL